MPGMEKNNRTWRGARWDSKVSHVPQRRYPVSLLKKKKKKKSLKLHHIKNKRKNQMLGVRIERKLLHNQQNGVCIVSLAIFTYIRLLCSLCLSITHTHTQTRAHAWACAHAHRVDCLLTKISVPVVGGQESHPTEKTSY